MTTFDKFTPPEGVALARRDDVPEGWLMLNANLDPNLDGWEWNPRLPTTATPNDLVWVKRPATIEIDADLAWRLAGDAYLAHEYAPPSAWGGMHRSTTLTERDDLRAAAHQAKQANR